MICYQILPEYFCRMEAIKLEPLPMKQLAWLGNVKIQCFLRILRVIRSKQSGNNINVQIGIPQFSVVLTIFIPLQQVMKRHCRRTFILLCKFSKFSVLPPFRLCADHQELWRLFSFDSYIIYFVIQYINAEKKCEIWWNYRIIWEEMTSKTIVCNLWLMTTLLSRPWH